VDAMVAEKFHERAGNLTAAWRSVADSLLAAAQVLRERSEPLDPGSHAPGAPVPPDGRLGAVELMLKGMAVECLLKALWLKQGNKLVEAGQYSGVPGAGEHDLPQLASVVKFTVDVKEKGLLRRLSHFIQYGGRYPVPKDDAKLRLTPTPGGGKASATTWATPGDDQLFDSLVSCLDTSLA